jgi:hypothetical protein
MSLRRIALVTAAALVGAATLRAQAAAQAAPRAPQAAADPLPVTIAACYVPASGTIYRINTTASPAPGAPASCLSPTHVLFQWNQQGLKGDKGDRGDPGPAGTATIGPDLRLAGKLTVGQTGDFGGGLLATDVTPLTVPVGAGTRLMWIPQKAAFRAGLVQSTQWSDGNIGLASTALGQNTTANGEYATAIGVTSTASGSAAVALGAQNTASGANAVAMGLGNTASGNYSTALGRHASTNSRTGAFVYSDNSSTTPTLAQASNEFLVRAAGGVRLRTSSDLSKGCNIDGAGNLTCTGTIGPFSITSSITRLTFEWVDVPGNDTRSLTLACPAGTVIIGGGVQTQQVSGGHGIMTGDLKVRQSYPDADANAWVAQVRNDDVFRGQMRVHAICLRA